MLTSQSFPVLTAAARRTNVIDNASGYLALDATPDEEIVTRTLAGETDLFEVIVRRHSLRLLRMAMSVVHNESDAEEVVQDTLVSAYQHLGQFAGRARFLTWLTRIALYKALARASSRAREVRLENEDGQEPSWLVHSGPTPEQRLSAAETASLLGTAIEALPETYRRVVMLRDIQELDTETAARELRITETNLKVRLHRARAMLRREWERVLTPAIKIGIPGATPTAEIRPAVVQ
jgi:RNA polymerase sigma-70 factor (ECF subfamily)